MNYSLWLITQCDISREVKDGQVGRINKNTIKIQNATIVALSSAQYNKINRLKK
ncbi:MAG: hypothetical protein PF503_06365 [Desulfobacula sp.]|nr:hypothetical protein [Desulfobacula sp.]